MTIRKPAILLLGVFALAALPAWAQQSASYRLDEHVLNAGGRPDSSAEPASVNFKISLDSIGDGVVARGLSSASYSIDAGFTNTYRPAGEVRGLVFVTKQQLRWDADPSAGVYDLYRGTLANIAGLAYGACAQPGLPVPSASDGDPVPMADVFFYLVTAENRLWVEGTKGYRSDGVERQGSVCP